MFLEPLAVEQFAPADGTAIQRPAWDFHLVPQTSGVWLVAYCAVVRVRVCDRK